MTSDEEFNIPASLVKQNKRFQLTYQQNMRVGSYILRTQSIWWLISLLLPGTPLLAYY